MRNNAESAFQMAGRTRNGIQTASVNKDIGKPLS